jgi:hypothetical protein
LAEVKEELSPELAPDDRMILDEVKETAEGMVVPEERVEAGARVEEKELESDTALQAGIGEKAPQDSDL